MITITGSGQVWNKKKIDITKDFNITSKVYFGTKDTMVQMEWHLYYNQLVLMLTEVIQITWI